MTNLRERVYFEVSAFMIPYRLFFLSIFTVVIRASQLKLSFHRLFVNMKLNCSYKQKLVA